jgi:hypothetical protein
MKTKQEILEKIHDKLADIQIMLDEERFTDSDIDDIYSSISVIINNVEEIVYVNRETV